MPAGRRVSIEVETWELKSPFRITGYTFRSADILHVTISADGITGHGEASGVYYLGETGTSLKAQAEAARPALERGADREALRRLLPAGGARNALDCALWDFEAKRAGRSIWDLTGIRPSAVVTVETVGIASPDRMADAAREISSARIKVKLDSEQPVERIAAVRAARPDAEIIVDINQGWSFAELQRFAPALRDLGVAMIEQPLPRGSDAELEDYDAPVTLCADESCLDTSEFEAAARRYRMINIKLDKTGGLTEALQLAALARSHGLELMVGNMVGTSLAMAPAFVIAQLCRFVDLDGPLFLQRDRDYAMHYDDGIVSVPDRRLWG